MVFFLLRRGDSLKGALLLGLAAPLVLLAHTGPMVAGSLIGVVGYIALACAMVLRLDRRSTDLEMALPIAGRELLIARTIGVLSTIWAPVIVAALLLLGAHPGEVRPLLQGAAVLTFAMLLPLSARLRQASITPWLSLGLWAGGVVAGAAMWFAIPPMVQLALFASASVALIARACLAVPAAFEISPRDVDEHRPATVRRRFGRPAWWPIFGPVMPCIGVGVFLWGFFFLPNLVIALEYAVIVTQIGILPREHTRWLQAFPISNRVLLWITMATTVVPFLAGVAIGTWVYRPAFIPQSHPRLGAFMPRFSSRDKHPNWTNVPLEFWRRAPGGIVPAIEAPWGETARPLSIAIVGLTFYNPYTASNANTERFFEWQVGNATGAMYGRRMSWEQAEYMPHEATPDYPQKNRVDILAFAALSVLVLFGVYLRELWLSRSWSHFALVVVAPMFVWMAADPVLSMARYGVPSVIGAMLQALFMYLAAVLPQNLLALAVIAAAPSLLMCLLVERQFARAEFTSPIVRPGWVER